MVEEAGVEPASEKNVAYFKASSLKPNCLLQNTTAPLQCANEFATLHADTSMSFVWMAADVGEVCSSSISR